MNFPRLCAIHIYKATTLLHMKSVELEEKESESNRARKETDSVSFCGGLLWNISVTIIKRVID